MIFIRLMFNPLTVSDNLYIYDIGLIPFQDNVSVFLYNMKKITLIE